MTTTVMKFGGTSVADADAIRRLIAIVRSEWEGSGGPPVVVVSAMAGVTDQLFEIAGRAAGGDQSAGLQGVDALRDRHRQVALALVDGAELSTLLDEVDEQFNELRAMFAALAILREASPRSLDGVASCGELLSSRIVAAALRSAGVTSMWVDARRVIVTDDTAACAVPQQAEISRAATRELRPHVIAGRVPVVGGYVGATAQGVTTTLGRGGSDFSAALIGAALNCREIQIWTDVDGMLTADPRIIGPGAPRLVSHLSFGEASELAYFGAKVLHPSTILPAVARDLPVRILNSRRSEGGGTLITASPPPAARPLAALACKRNVTVIEVTSTRMLMAHGFLRRLFEVFECFRTSVDAVTTSEVSVSMTVDDDRNLESIVDALREFADVVVDRDMALLCAVGDNLRADPTLAVRVLATLEGFPLRMVSQAASRRNITVVLYARDVAAAMSRLHDVWFVNTNADRRGSTWMPDVQRSSSAGTSG